MVPGGEHAEDLTPNVLVPFAGSTYLEFVAFVDFNEERDKAQSCAGGRTLANGTEMRWKSVRQGVRILPLANEDETIALALPGGRLRSTPSYGISRLLIPLKT